MSDLPGWDAEPRKLDDDAPTSTLPPMPPNLTPEEFFEQIHKVAPEVYDVVMAMPDSGYNDTGGCDRCGSRVYVPDRKTHAKWHRQLTMGVNLAHWAARETSRELNKLATGLVDFTTALEQEMGGEHGDQS